MSKEVDKRMASILGKHVTPFLANLGFKKQGMVYSKVVNNAVTWLIDIQKSRWNDDSESNFTLNCGVFVPGVVSTYLNMVEPAKVKLEHRCCSARIGMLTPERFDLWWTLNAGEGPEIDEEIGQDIRLQLDTHVVLFLSKFNTAEAVAEFLSAEPDTQYRQVNPQSRAQRLAYASLIYLRVGDRGKAEKILDSAVVAAAKSPIESVVGNLRQRLFG